MAASDGWAPKSTRSVDELWLETLQRLTVRAAHEIKGALNGVSVNLEVVRSRAAKPDAPAAVVAPFASSAADQLELVVGMTEAMLALSRAPREPVEVMDVVSRLVALMAPSVRGEGGSLTLEEPGRDSPGKSVGTAGNVVRLLVGGALLAALARKGNVRCRVDASEDVVVTILRGDDEGRMEIAPVVLAAAADAGVGVRVDGHGISLTFPRAGAARQRTHETS